MEEHEARGTFGSSGHAAGFATRAIHEGDIPSGVAEQPVSPPIWLTADYLYDGLDHYADVINERRPGYVYGRYGNPTHIALHRVLASLDGAEAAWSFASGMAAIHTALVSLLEPGDRLLVQRAVYGGTYAVATKILPRYGIDVSLVEAEGAAVAEAVRPDTKAILVEPIANPTFRVSDMVGIADVCADRGVVLVVDNSIPTPYLLRPLELPGAVLVVQSTTKYVGGHSDLMGGSVTGPSRLVDGIRTLAIELGATAGAFEAWLALRGVQTLALRMQRQCSTAAALAQALSGLASVESVGYSGLPDHPDHRRASALFGGSGYGAMLSVTVRGGYEAGARFAGSLRIARVGSSFGGLHTEVCHPATTSHRQLSPQDLEAAGIGDGLLRVAVGGEDPEDLLADFAQALEKA